MKVVEGNLLNQTPGVLCHQVNLRGVMGAGIALQIRQKWPTVYDDYIRYCRKDPKLGDVQFCPIPVAEGKSKVVVSNLFGQASSPDHRCQTVYTVYPEMLMKVRASAAHWDIPVYIPYGIGCGIAGGDWSWMIKLLEENIPDAILMRFQP